MNRRIRIAGICLLGAGVVVPGASALADESVQRLRLVQAASPNDPTPPATAPVNGGRAEENNDADTEALDDALWFAAANGETQRFLRLLARGADIEVRVAGSTTALWIAAQEGHSDIVRILLGLGAEVDARDAADGRTPLFQAAQEGHSEIVALLLQSGAEIETGSKRTGATPLFVAASRGHAEVVRLLLAAGADSNATASAEGGQDTPLAIARQRGHSEVIELLEP